MPRGNGGIIGPVNTSFSGVWSLTEAQLRRSANTWPNFYAALLSESATGTDVFSGADAADPYFEYTTLLLPGNGTNLKNNNEFLDSSSNAFTITRNPLTGPNAPTQGTFSPFSQTGWGNYFDGTGDSIYASSANTANAMGTGDWTIEASVYKTNSTEGYVFDTLALTGGSTDAIRISISSSGAVYFYKYSTLLTSGGSIALNTWNHIAVVRQSQTIKIYLNGTQVNTTYSDTGSNYTCGTNRPLVGINGYDIASDPFQGYISNLRAVKGVAVYTGNFTPPTSPLAATQSAGTNISAITGTQTSLLTCQSNRFIDNSSNNFTITRNGDTRVVAFSPFNPTASWSAATYGGSGYFDGNGDYLSIPNSANLNSTGDFTIEGWAYITSASSYAGMFSMRASTGTTNGASITFINTGYIEFAVNPGGNNLTTPTPLNQWFHVALVRSGSSTNNCSCYLNGTRVAQFTSTSQANGASNGAVIGRYYADGTNQYWVTGYLSNVRYVVGTAVYSGATITVPTTPLTAISGTQFLCNFTNAGIYDATSKNDLETVGNAQISTAISAKWGSGSMYFDGTGDYLLLPDGNLWDFGSGSFTIEFWTYISSLKSDFKFILKGTASNNYWQFHFNNGGSSGPILSYNTGGGQVIVAQQGSTTGWSTGVWYHVALVRNGTAVNIYRDGTSVASGTLAGSLPNPATGASIAGTPLDTAASLNGYLQDVRITKGYARYTANFTPPTAAFPTL